MTAMKSRLLGTEEELTSLVDQSVDPGLKHSHLLTDRNYPSIPLVRA